MGWPQWVVLGLVAYNVAAGALFNGRPSKPIRFPLVLATSAMWILLLWAGGFFG